jgi:hypothetical protein
MSISVLAALGPIKKTAGILLVGVIGIVIGAWISNNVFSDATPVQPIEFSHRIHAGENQMPCMYCHLYARRSRVAGVPSVHKCINCHKVIATGRPEINKLFKYWDEKKPIPWIKVHDLPDFVYFPHKRHVRGGVQCQMCHGPVEEMNRVTRVASLQMGWCLECHRARKVENGRDCWTCHK